MSRIVEVCNVFNLIVRLLTELVCTDLTNAIKIRRGKESFVYRTSFPDDKKVLLGAFRKVAEDLAVKKRKESEKEQERRKSMWAGDVSTLDLSLLAIYTFMSKTSTQT